MNGSRKVSTTSDSEFKQVSEMITPGADLVVGWWQVAKPKASI